MTEFDAETGVFVVLVAAYVLILISLLVMIILVGKWTPAFSPFKQPAAEDVPEIPMVGVQLPITIQVLELQKASFTDGVKLHLKTDNKSELHAFWGVECTRLQQLLQNNPLQLVQQANILLQDKCLAENHTLCFEENSDEELLIRLPEDTHQFSLGPPPRTRYPLCLIIKCRPTETTQLCVIGSIVLIHVPDATLQEKCHVISHILVTNKGQAHDLQGVYMATDGEENTDQYSSTRTKPPLESPVQHTISDDGLICPDTETQHSEEETIPRDCTVCQNAPITRVILPCRHACVCHTCFPLLNRCPMCRGVIYSFFSMTADLNQLEDDGIQDGMDEEKDWISKIENGCERLNQWLGIHH